MRMLDLYQFSFVVLKATGAIRWSWWLVLIPFYVMVAFQISDRAKAKRAKAGSNP